KTRTRTSSPVPPVPRRRAVMFRIASTMVRAAGLGALVLTIGATSAMARGASRGNDFEYRWTLRSGQTLEVRDLNGSIRVVPASGRTARVTAEKSGGKRCDPDEVRIEASESENGVIVCA